MDNNHPWHGDGPLPLDVQEFMGNHPLRPLAGALSVLFVSLAIKPFARRRADRIIDAVERWFAGRVFSR